MPLDDRWDVGEDGKVLALPFSGWSIATLPPLGLLRVEYYESERAFDARQVSAVQLHMNASQARELALGLLRMAGGIEVQDTGIRQ